MNEEVFSHPQMDRRSSLEIDDWIVDALSQHENGLVRYAQVFVGNTGRSKDVVQDTFLKLCQLSESERDEIRNRLSNWLYKVCRNRAIDICRKESRMKMANPEVLAEHPVVAPGPGDQALQVETDEKIANQIEQLPVNQREVLRLKFHGGLSYQEIADITGLTSTNVGFLLHTAIKGLRAANATV